MKKPPLYGLIFNLLVCVSAHAEVFPFPTELSERENTSPIRFEKAIKPSEWCPEKRMMVATVSAPKTGLLRTNDPNQFTVYVDDDIVVESFFRIEPRSIQVCIAASGSPKVFAAGPDNRGRGIEFSSTYSPDK